MGKYLLSILFFIFFINGCSFSKDIEKKCINIRSSNFFAKKSNLIFSKFNYTVEKMILKMFKPNTIFVFKNTLFFINLLENNTNIFIDTKKITNVIKNKITKKNKKIKFLSRKIVEQNKETLGILKIKNTLDTSAAILLSRNNNVKYYIHSCIYSENESFLLKMEVVLVKTGEVVFMKTEKFY